MSEIAGRIRSGADLGRAKRSFDLFLGTSALVPILGCAALPWVVPDVPGPIVRTLAVMWGASLITFFAGVRRGLTFSETGGGKPGEIATMLGLFFLGVVSLFLVSPLLAAIGLAAVGVLDALAGRKLEAPPYFAAFRPVQMALGALGLLIVQWKVG
jgi:RsiW-degrading membrane proteinase PrsW (M82 family)